MDKSYVEQRDGGYYLAGERVSLDSLLYAFRRGASPESIRCSFPVLTLEQEVDAYLEEAERTADAQGVEINARARGQA